MTRTYVLDTNVLLHNPKSLFVFEEHEVILPNWVLEEVDKFKSDQTVLGFNARTTGRYLDKMRERGSLKEGVPLQGGGTLKVDWDGDVETEPPSSMDNAILKTAQRIMQKYADVPDHQVVLVSRDINMRVKADALGILAENYKHDQAAEPDKQYTGYQEVDCLDYDIEQFYAGEQLDRLILPENLNVHEFVHLKGSLKSSALARWDGNKLLKIPKVNVWKIQPRNREQSFALDLLQNPDIKLVTLSGIAGSGKAQPLDADILTPNGWVKMGDIHVGDRVSTPDGGSAQVSGVFPQGGKDVYAVHFTDGTSTECCKDHLWYTQTSRERDAHQQGAVRSLADIMDTLRFGTCDKRNHSIPITQPVQFPDAELTIHPYVMGVLLGDGCMAHPAICLSSKDEYIVETVGRHIEAIGCALRKKPKAKYDYAVVNPNHPFGGAPSFAVLRTEVATGETLMYADVRAAVSAGFSRDRVYMACKQGGEYQGFLWAYQKTDVLSNNPVRDALMKLGLSGHKSDTKFIPENYKFGSVAQRVALLQGLLDTDGTISKTGNHVTFTSISHRLASDVQWLVQSLGGTNTITSRITSYTYKGVKKKGQVSYTCHICLPNDICPFQLPRKALRVVARTKYHPRRYIDRVEFVGVKPAQCIMVDSAEHLYITNDCIVTHNTLLAIAAGLMQVCDQQKYTKLLVSRPVIPMGKDIGFLPGTLSEKLAPWMQPIFDNLEILMPGKPGADRGSSDASYQYLIDRGLLQVEALTYIRGRSIPNQFMLVDEAQNLSNHEIKTIISRAGEGTKIVLTGDPAQIDNPYVDARSNGLTYVLERFKDSKIAGHVTLSKGERSQLSEEATKRL